MPELLVPADIARFVLAYAAFIVAPGFAVAALLRPRSDALERLVFSIPCGYGLVVLCGLATALAHIPFGLPIYLPCAVAVTGCGGYATVRQRSGWERGRPARPGHGARPRPPSPQGEALAHAAHAAPAGWFLYARQRLGTGGTPALPGRPMIVPAQGDPCSHPGGDAGRRDQDGQQRGTRWAWIPACVGLLQAALLLLSQRHAIPASSDVISHVVWTNLIARTHTFPIALLSSNNASGDGAFYPPAFHAVTALVLAAVPMPEYHAVIYSVLAAVFMLPLGLCCFVRTATGSAQIGAFAALAALAFEPLPFFVGAEGLLTFVAAQTFVPALALALYEGLAHGRRGATILAGLIGIGLFYTHPTEFLTAGLLAATIIFSPLRSARAWGRACLYGIGVVATWLIAAAPALAAVHRTMAVGAQGEINATHDFTRPARVDVLADIHAYFQWIYGQDLGYLLLGAVLLGIVGCLARRCYLALVAVQLLIAALALDSESYNLLRPLYTLSFPWALWERIAATHYWFALPLAAIGIDAAVRFAGRLLQGKRASFVAIGVAPFVLLGLLLPLAVSAQRAAVFADGNSVTNSGDGHALMWLADHGSPAEVVVNDGGTGKGSAHDPIDSSMSLPLVGGPRPLFARLGGGPGTAAERVYLVRHITDDSLPPRAARYVATNDVRYVYYGSHSPDERDEGGLHLTALLTSPRLRLAYSSVTSCQGTHLDAPRECPPTGAYVFALVPQTSQTAVARNSHVRAAAGRLSSR